jgi:hypothetical protein
MAPEWIPFILLGLLLSIGYLVWRAGPGSRARREKVDVDVLLFKAEREAREKAARERGVLSGDPAMDKVRRMAEKAEDSTPQTPDRGDESIEEIRK